MCFSVIAHASFLCTLPESPSGCGFRKLRICTKHPPQVGLRTAMTRDVSIRKRFPQYHLVSQRFTGGQTDCTSMSNQLAASRVAKECLYFPMSGFRLLCRFSKLVHRIHDRVP